MWASMPSKHTRVTGFNKVRGGLNPVFAKPVLVYKHVIGTVAFNASFTNGRERSALLA